MKLIIGLGNPGVKYAHNRHNVGFMLLDHFIGKMDDGTWKFEKKLESEIAQIQVNGEKIILAKPQTFMNESGRAVKKIAAKYKILNTKYIYIVHDDLDIRLGEYKIQFGRGPKVHGGIQSVQEHLQTSDFWRVRIGVDNRDPDWRMPGELYVLQDLRGKEENVLKKTFEYLLCDLIS